MTGQNGGSGTNSSCQDFVVNSPKNLRQLDEVTNAFQSLEEVELYLGGDRVICLECGLDFAHLGGHIRWSHRGMTVKDYKRKYNIPFRFALTGVALLTGWKNARKAIYKDPARKKEQMGYLKKAQENHKPALGGGSKFRNVSEKATPALKAVIDRIAKEKHAKYRPSFLGAISHAIQEDISLSTACKATGVKRSSIMAHLKRNPDDKEMINLFAKIKVRELPKGIRMMSSKFQARQMLDKKMHHLGVFDTLEEAQQAISSWQGRQCN